MKVMTWSYKCLPVNPHYSAQAINEKLNVWGNNGWELVQMNSQFIIFKRPNGYLKNPIDSEMIG